jgi:hypothetical protein
LALFQQVPEVQNRGLIRNPAIDQHLLHQRVR